MSKILFLDIDGVLNGVERPGVNHLDFLCVSNLNEIIRDTEAQIVVSSSWAHQLDFEDLVRRLREGGGQGDIVGATRGHPDSPARREDEIQEWLSAHPNVVQFTILEDFYQMGSLQARTVRTDSRCGLTGADVDLARGLLA